MGKCTDLTGQKFGKLIVNGFSHFDKHHHSHWTCRCECGTIKSIARNALICNLTKSCGCYHKTVTRLRPFESRYNYLLNFNQTSDIVEITYEDFVKFTNTKNCHYCTAIIPWTAYQGNGKKGNNSYYLDRMDNSKGYTLDNCVVCCPRCNKGKGFSFTYQQWYKMTEPFRTGELV